MASAIIEVQAELARRVGAIAWGGGAGQVAHDGAELGEQPGVVRALDPPRELVRAQPLLGVVPLELADRPLAIGVGGAHAGHCR